MSRPYNPASLHRTIAEQAGQRCGYCQTAQAYSGGQLHIDHVIGQTPSGRATVIALKLNNDYIVPAQKNWVRAGWHPPKK